MGANVVVDGTQQSLQEVGEQRTGHVCDNWEQFIVMNETNGDGVGRIVDASGVPSVVNNCFTMLR